MTIFGESTVEEIALAWLESLGWQVADGPDMAPDPNAIDRVDYGEVLLGRRLRRALPLKLVSGKLRVNVPDWLFEEPA